MKTYKKFREWLLWHAPEWYIDKIWYPIWNHFDSKKR